MNNIRKALRYIYIYIYILTHANAGWAYDRQSRDVCKRRWRGYRRRSRDHHRKQHVEAALHLPRRSRRGKRYVYAPGKNDDQVQSVYGESLDARRGERRQVHSYGGRRRNARGKLWELLHLHYGRGRSAHRYALTSKEVAA